MWLSFLRNSLVFILLNLQPILATDAFIEKRETVLNELVQLIAVHKQVNVYGLSGMGKTTIARQLFSLFTQKGYQTFWFDWDENSISEQVINQIVVLKKMIKDTDKTTYIYFADYLKNVCKPILIVVDNYNHTELSGIKKKLGDLTNGMVYLLITSRGSIDAMHNYQLPLFSKAEAVSLMKKHLPDEDTEKLGILVQNLGLYPYYIAMVASLIKESPTLNVKRMLETTENHQKVQKMIEKSEKTMGFSAIKNQINELKERDKDAYLLLGFASLLHSQNIPLDLLMLFMGSEERTEQIIGDFSKRALIAKVLKEDEIAYNLHEITQNILISTISPADKQKIFERGVKAFIGFYKNHFEKIFDLNKEQQVFYNHIFAFLNHFSEKEALDLRVLALKRDVYSKRNVKGAFTQVQKIEKYEPDQIQDKDILFEYFVDKAFLLCFHYAEDQKKFAEGITCGQKALHIGQEMQDSKKIFKALTRLSWIQLYAGNLQEGRGYLERAEKLLKNIEDPYLRKEYFFGASWLYVEEGDFDKAIILSKEGIKIDNESKNANIGLYLYLNQAICFYRFKNYKDCLATIEKALARERLIFGKDSSLAQGELLQVQAMAQKDDGLLSEAEVAIRRSLEIFQLLRDGKLYQPAAVSLKVLGEILLKKGEATEAKSALEEAVRQFVVLTPIEGTYEFAEALYLLADIYLNEQDTKKFKPVYSHLETRFGTQHELITKLYKKIVKSDLLWMLL